MARPLTTPLEPHRMPTFPSDWPGEGPIDLRVHDLPHGSSTTEWWYVNAHLETADRRRLSIFAAFFRIVTGQNATTKAQEYAHSVTWAISDADGGRYFSTSFVDKRAPQLGIERVDRGEGTRDPRLQRAIKEVLLKGRVPAPTGCSKGTCSSAAIDWTSTSTAAAFRKRDDGSYELELRDDKQRTGAQLVFFPEKPPARHGDNGVVKSIAGEDMFYYFIPRCRVTGTVTTDGLEHTATRGQGWYDHEFGRYLETRKDGKRDIIWNWASVQLHDGRDVTAFSLTDRKTGGSAGQWGVLVEADGTFRTTSLLNFAPGELWSSTRTFFEYPVRWTLQMPEFDLNLSVDAAFRDQEFISLVRSRPSGRGDARSKARSVISR